MRATRLLLASVAALLLLAILAAWLVPGRLDWNRFRPEIERFSSAQLGREVRIEGPITVTLLPQPVITASAVTLAGVAPIHADTLRLRVGLGALLAGHIEAAELVLRGVDMRIPWPLPASTYPVRPPTWLAAVSARIEQGRVSVGTLTFTGIEATLTTGELTGSYAAAGTGQLYGRAWHFTARLTQPGGDGSAALDATLDGQGPAQGFGATLSGQLGRDGAFGGRVAARGPDLSQLLPAPAVAFSAEGRVTVADGLAAADDLALDIGGSPTKAAVAFRVTPTPRLDVALAASRIDLDAWLPALTRANAAILPLGIDLSAEAAQLAGGTLRRLRAAIDLSGIDADIREFSAILPGDAQLTLAGRATRPASAPPTLDAAMSLTAPHARVTLAWLGAVLAGLRATPDPAATLPPDVAHDADLTATISLTRERLSATALAGTLDGSPIHGDASLAFGRRLSYLARLSLDHLSLDPWLRPGAFDPGRSDIDATIDIGTANWAGHALAPLHLDGTIESGRATIRALRIAVSGVHASLAGTLVEGGRITDGALDVTADNGAQLAGLFPAAFATVGDTVPLLLRLPVHAHADLAGRTQSLASHLTLTLGDLRVTADPVIDVPGLGWSGPLTMRHPGAPRLAELLGLGGAPAWLGDGSFALVAQVAGKPGKWTASSFDIAAGSLHATGQLTLDTADPTRRLTGQIQADALPLPFPYIRSPEPLPLPSLAGWQANIALQARTVLFSASPLLEQATANLVVTDGVVLIQGLKARLGGGQLTGTASLDTAHEPRRLAATMDLSGATIGGALFGTAIDLTAGTLDGRLAVEAVGNSPAGLLATTTGILHLEARAGTLAGLDLGRASDDLSEAAARASLAGGSMKFDRLGLDATIDRGQMTIGTALVEAPSGQLRLTGAVDLLNGTAALHVTARPQVADPPDIGLTLTGPLDAPKRTPELAGVAKWLVARAAPAPAPEP